MYRVMFRTSFCPSSGAGASINVVIEGFPSRAEAELAIQQVDKNKSPTSSSIITQSIRLYQ